MKLQEINKEKTPELFYSKLVDNIWVETESMNITGGIQLRKRCLKGWQDILLRYGALKLYFVPEKEDKTPDESNAKLVADGILIPQKKVNGEWVNMTFSVDDISSFTANDPMLEDLQMDVDKDAYSVFDNGVDSVVVDFKWRIGDSKQTYRIESDIGTVVRMAAIVNDYKEEGVDVKQDFSDFLGLTLTETLTEQDDLLSTKYIFESDGKELTESEPFFEVDPYLKIDEQSTYIDVFSDGFGLRFRLDGNTNSLPIVYGTDHTTILARMFCSLMDSSDVIYYLVYDENITYSVLAATPTYIQLSFTGKFDNDYGSGTAYLQNTSASDAESVTYIFSIYPDRIGVSLTWEIATTVILGASTTNGPICLMENGLTNEANIYENGGSESTATYTDADSAKYIGWTADEMNVLGVCLEHSESGPDYHQRLHANGDSAFQWESGTMAVGTHTMSVMWVIDSAQREGGKLYDGSQLVAANIKVDDSFDTDSSAAYKYYDSDPAATFGSGKVVCSSAWDGKRYVWDTSLGTDDMWAEFSMIANGRNCWLLAEIDYSAETGYAFSAADSGGTVAVSIMTYTTGNSSWKNSINTSYTYSSITEYTVKVKKVADYNYAVFLNGEYLGVVTDGDSTYSGGQYAGFVLSSGSVAYNPEVTSFSCGVFSADLRIEQGDQYKDSTLALTTGLTITSGVGTTSIGSSGFNADGGWHLTSSDGSGTTKYTNDIIRHKKVDVLHDFPIQSGSTSSPTTYLIGHWKCEDNAASTVVLDDESKIGNMTASANTSTLTVTDEWGTGLQLDQGSSEYFEITLPTSGDYDPANWVTLYSIEIKFKPNFDIDVATSQYLFSLLNGSEVLRYFYDSGDNRYEERKAGYISLPTITDPSNYSNRTNDDLRKLHTIKICFDTSNGHHWRYFDGILESSISTTEAWSADPTTLSIGRYSTIYGSHTIYDVKVYETPIISYGAYFTGNGSVNTAIAHKNISLYTPLNSLTGGGTGITGGSGLTVTGSPSLATGVDGVSNSAMEFNASGEYVNVPSSGNIDLSKGSISFWFKSNVSFTDSAAHFIFGSRGAGSTAGDFRINKWTDNAFYFILTDSGSTTRYILFTNTQLGTNWTSWNHYCCRWDDTNPVNGTLHMSLEVNGIWIDPNTDSGVSTSWTSATPLTNYAIGNDILDTSRDADGIIDEFYITNDPNTPQIPTANGIPLHIPLKGDA
ncbi:MAG: LamG domain-containing protein [bacterium]|nr:LamG domain-containing protein [bacterium]